MSRARSVFTSRPAVRRRASSQRVAAAAKVRADQDSQGDNRAGRLAAGSRMQPAHLLARASRTSLRRTWERRAREARGRRSVNTSGTCPSGGPNGVAAGARDGRDREAGSSRRPHADWRASGRPRVMPSSFASRARRARAREARRAGSCFSASSPLTTLSILPHPVKQPLPSWPACSSATRAQVRLQVLSNPRSDRPR
jgi:hypothetical protein